MESWESPSHSLISTIQSNSLLSTHPSIESQTEMIASSPQEPMDGTSQDNESTHEFSYVRYCNGVMGVPITFLDKYSPEQFLILDLNPHFFTIVAMGKEKPKQLTLQNANKKDPYARVLIKKKG